MKTRESRSLAPEYRIQARRLLKQLRSGPGEAPAAAAARFRRLQPFSSRTILDILAARGAIRLKHALAVVALEQGYPSWTALKLALDTAGSGPGAPPAVHEMYERGLDVLLNRWYASYDDARASLEREGGYLLPFHRHFFICETEGIRVLGLDPGDPDWERIGRDWVRPADADAWLRLRNRRERAVLAAGGRDGS